MHCWKVGWKVAPTRRRLIGLVAAALVTAGSGAMAASPDKAAAEAVVQRLVEQIADMLSTNGIHSPEGIQRLGRTIQEEADLDRLGRLVLGRHWRAASEQQRADYQALFRAFMLNKFAGYLGSYGGGDPGPTEDFFRILGSQIVSDQDVVVRSEVRPRDHQPLEVSWRVRERDDGNPAVIDVIVGGISLLISQRSEFGAVIERQGMDGLLAELRARLDRADS